MNIAELFINLGVKGTEKTLSGVQGIQKGLKDTASTSLEAKAALVGAMYALERLFSASGKVGTDLTNFNATVGTSAKTLQQYQYAARQVGVSNDEVTNSFRGLQKSMTDTLLNGQAPKGMARLAQIVGDVKKEDIEEWSRKPELLFQKLQEYANKERSLPLRNEVLRSFGMSDNMIAAMSRNAFRPDVMKKAPTYSDGEVKALDRANVAWSNLGNKIEMAVGHFNAMHGGQLVGEISKITDKVLALADSFMKVADKVELFKGIGKVFEGWGLIFDGISKTVDNLVKLAGIADDLGAAKTTEFITGGLISEEDAKKGAEAVKGAWSSVSDFLADKYGELVEGVPQSPKPAEQSDADKVRANPNYTPPHLQGASDNVIKAWREDAFRREKASLDLVNALEGDRKDGVPVKPAATPGAPPAPKTGVSAPTSIARPPTTARTPSVSAVPPTVNVKTTVSTPPGPVPKKVAPGAPPERHLKAVPPPPTAVPPAPKVATPPLGLPARQAAAAAASPAKGAPAVVNFEQNVNFNHTGAVDPQRAAAATRNGVREAYREMSAQGEGG